MTSSADPSAGSVAGSAAGSAAGSGQAAGVADTLARAQALQGEGQAAAARALYEQVLRADPRQFDALNALGALSGQAREFDAALAYLDRAIAVRPQDPAPHVNRGNVLRQLKRSEAALASFDAALAVHRDDAIAYYGRAEAQRDLGRGEPALADYAAALAINPALVPAHVRRALLLQELGRFEDSLSAFDAALGVAPGFADAHAYRGLTLFHLRRFEEAVASYDRAIAIRSDQAATHLFRGNALKELNRLPEAVASYDRALAAYPQYAEAYANRGIVLTAQGRMDEALASYDRALEIRADAAPTHFNRGFLLRIMQRYAEASAAYRAAAALAPELDFLPGARLEASLQGCDWSEFDALVAEVTAGVLGDRPVSHPATLLAALDSPSLHLRAAQIWVRRCCPPDAALGPPPVRRTAGKLRVGYFSADFREHPLSRLLADLIETHDRSRFEVLGFAFGPPVEDAARRRLERGFDRFIDIHEMSDLDAAALARRLEVDIAIDLGGYTYNCRSGIFALRAAPLQINYLGYLGTLGAPYIDYLIADHTVVTPESESCFTEKMIYLPDCFQVNDRTRLIADRIFTRAELQLPASGCVFCCFNTSYKILPETFASWMRILKRAPQAVLLLVAGDAATVRNLRAQADAHGVDPDRLRFAEVLGSAEYLARYRSADLFLDTLPYNAGVTASDALWAGLPVLTLAGASYAARMAASLLKAVGLPELVVTTRPAYEDLAVELAENPQRVAELKARLARNRATCPLFDTVRFARNLESAYLAIHERHAAGLPPEHIEVREGGD